VTLDELNGRWTTTGLPHAVPKETGYVMHCPSCDYTSHTPLPLFAAMNDAVTHKRECVEIN
jgi:hypothetical protein